MLLAISIFFSAIALITFQAPGLFFPDTLSVTDETTAADRIGLELTNSHLTEPGSHAGLSHDAVVAFLGEEDENDLRDIVSVPENRNIQVTLMASADDPPKALDPDAVDYDVNERDGWNYATRGDELDGESETTTRVTTSLDGKTVVIEVTLW